MNDHITYLNYAPAADRNRALIWSEIQLFLNDGARVLEIGSGSGQHALHFCSQDTSLNWQCSEQDEYAIPLKINLDTLQPGRFCSPIVLNVQDPDQVQHVIKVGPFDVLYTANTLHIMSWEACLALFDLAHDVLPKGGRLCVYGPFLYEHRETADSNLAFDVWLKQRDPQSGIRAFQDVNHQLGGLGFELIHDADMSANNQFLVLQKQ